MNDQVTQTLIRCESCSDSYPSQYVSECKELFVCPVCRAEMELAIEEEAILFNGVEAA